jgi:hypothetical protein
MLNENFNTRLQECIRRDSKHLDGIIFKKKWAGSYTHKMAYIVTYYDKISKPKKIYCILDYVTYTGMNVIWNKEVQTGVVQTDYKVVLYGLQTITALAVVFTERNLIPACKRRKFLLCDSVKRVTLGCLHPVALVRSDDVGFNPSTQRHYRRLIYYILIYT